MPDYEMHDPEFSGTTTDEWAEPRLEDFSTDDLSEAADHFVLSASGFPPENFTDLKLPVVEPSGELNRNALQTAKSGGHGVGAVEGLDDEKREAVDELIDRLANEHFEEADFGD
ncbi:hypothetical protein [Halomontanus rarus]|uniref:hypothetical protein n=1 Tax=Halomontanus rarus TaxID=3034020 RepID=UPI001A9A1E8A